ncbi:MAG: acyl carrier protein [Actinomycetota bacterium]
MFEKIRRLLAEACRVDPETITRETRIGELPIDSLELVEFSLAVEEEVSLDVPDSAVETQDLERMTVGELVELLERRGRQGKQQ